MKNLLPVAIVLLSALTGAGLAFNEEVWKTVSELSPERPDSEKIHHKQGNSSGFVLGSAHEHALLYIIVNGTELEFTEDRYMVAESYVHLENNRSHIVHKHAEGVTWKDFFDTINVSVEQGDQLCLKAKNISRCGNGTVWMNGKKNVSLNQEIMQDDRMIIVLGGNVSEAIEDYHSNQLPPAYTPESTRGRRL